MTRKFFRKWLPDPANIKHHNYLRLFGPLLQLGYLWHLNRYTVARAVSVGLFCAYLPIPFQMLVATAMAIIFRCNLALSVSLVWISNPLTMPPLFYIAYRVGLWMLHRPPGIFSFDLSWHWFSQQAGLVLAPLLLGSIMCGISLAVLGYWLVRLLWYYHLVHHWHKRKQRLL